MVTAWKIADLRGCIHREIGVGAPRCISNAWALSCFFLGCTTNRTSDHAVCTRQAIAHLYYSLPTSTMATNSQRLKGRNGALSTLNAAIGGLNLAKQISNDTSAKVVFGSVSRLLTTIRVRFCLLRGDELSTDVCTGFNAE